MLLLLVIYLLHLDLATVLPSPEKLPHHASAQWFPWIPSFDHRNTRTFRFRPAHYNQRGPLVASSTPYSIRRHDAAPRLLFFLMAMVSL